MCEGEKGMGRGMREGDEGRGVSFGGEDRREWEVASG